ncbi:MAG: hypothetical protein HQK88_10625 [Nitrospirae bacterium]|nr:hypothetical protein [Nitrospirota bacterium]MBF0535324.1 hypothetical protein [Nitrospirota bacterium]MBF0617253.1 hypothetical protein [Nitrospirota bacterium]
MPTKLGDRMQPGITEETAMFLLENDIEDCERQLKNNLGFMMRFRM